jgi:hypothetical protein
MAIPGRIATAIALVSLFACRTGDPGQVGELDIFQLLDATRDAVLKDYGSVPSSDTLCYSDGQTFALFSTDEDDESGRMWRVTFSSAPLCAKPQASRRKLIARTPKGTRIGDSVERLFQIEGADLRRMAPSDLRAHADGPLTADQLDHLGEFEYQFHETDLPVLSIFTRKGRVTGMAAWFSD